ncbi:hypothetical protein OH76DRAFT_1416481 [Lentinus brumalis]|uniref:BZIP domain-containing protein n=1 Tax=Lentinus brumalis TaxID=2498619 RepID=A0A371DJV3_9APHY|nr:hypothetical protein OH76DRAFT_1416481 [Polyporus brumalis]
MSIAQARHRAKRKAYLAQLEHSVESLQSTLGIIPGREYETPPLVVKVRKLERENEALRRELYDLRRRNQANGHAPSGGYTPDNSTPLGAEGPIHGQDVAQVVVWSTRPVFSQRPYDGSSGSHYPPSSPINYAYGVQGYPAPSTTTRSSATNGSHPYTVNQYASSPVPVIQHHISSSAYPRRAQPVFTDPTYDPRVPTVEGDHYQGDVPDISPQGSPYFPATIDAVSPPSEDIFYLVGTSSGCINTACVFWAIAVERTYNALRPSGE